MRRIPLKILIMITGKKDQKGKNRKILILLKIIDKEISIAKKKVKNNLKIMLIKLMGSQKSIYGNMWIGQMINQRQ